MKRSFSIFAVLILVLGLASCTLLDDLLGVNLFAESLELSASDVQSSSIRELLAKSDSAAFYAAAGDDPAVKTALLDKTRVVIDDESASPLAIQEAGILGANVLIHTSPAGDLLANAMALADGLPANPTMEDLLNLILPDSVYHGGALAKGPFVEMINAFVDANVYYSAIGNSLGAEYLTSEVSAGDIAVGAYLAAVLVSIDSIPAEYDRNVGAYLYAVLAEGVGAPDFTAPDTNLAEYKYLANILDAAKLGSLLDL